MYVVALPARSSVVAKHHMVCNGVLCCFEDVGLMLCSCHFLYDKEILSSQAIYLEALHDRVKSCKYGVQGGSYAHA